MKLLFALLLFLSILNSDTLALLSENNISTNKNNIFIQNKEEHLTQIFVLIQEQRAINEDLYKEVSSTKNPLLKEKLLKNLATNQKRLFKLEESFNEVIINGININSIDDDTKKDKKTFEENLMEIFEPLIISLKRATEHPRQIENVRSEIEIYEARLPDFDAALQAIKRLPTSTLSPELQEKISKMQKQIKRQKLLLTNHLSVLKEKLKEYESYESSMFDNASDGVVDFIKGRGLNILLALSGFILTLSLLLMVRKRVQNKFEHVRHQRNMFLLRVTQLGLGIFSVVMAIAVSLVIFYIQADWLMLALSFLLLLGIAWSIKSFLPGFLDEAKLILNMGIVREEERVVYNGLPWRVKSIGMIAILDNPYLSASEMRVKLDSLKNLNARQVEKNEPWFPSEVEDYVILEDTVYGKVVLQTPEVVNIRTYSRSIKSYNTKQYLALNPTNLSKNGFGIFITIKLDYAHKDKITSSICSTLEKSLKKEISKESFQDSLLDLTVEFKKASSHSLDIQVLSTFDGKVANDFYYIKRTIRKIALDTANDNNWSISYTKIKIDTLSLKESSFTNSTTLS